MGGGEDAKWTAPRTITQTLNEELTDPSSVQSYPVRTYGIDRWMSIKLLGRLTAKLVNRLTR